MPLLASQLGSTAIGPTSGGKVTVINNLGTSAQLIVGANQYRTAISFANPGTITVYIAPLVNSQGLPFTPTLAALGGCFPVGPGSWFTLVGEAQTGWQALASAGSNNPFTVMESNV